VLAGSVLAAALGGLILATNKDHRETVSRPG
jgi:hypothetical protein